MSRSDCAQREDADSSDAQTDGLSLNPRDVDRTNTKEQTEPGDRDRQNDSSAREKHRQRGAGTLLVTQRVPRPGERRATLPGAAL